MKALFAGFILGVAVVAMLFLANPAVVRGSFPRVLLRVLTTVALAYLAFVAALWAPRLAGVIQ